MTSIEKVLGEFVEAWNAGRRPDVDDYLARVAPGDRESLVDELRLWLEVAPSPDYDAATLADIARDPALMAALAAGVEAAAPWPVRVRRLRENAGLAIEQVAERIAAVVGAPQEARRAARYLDQLEHDELDERRVSERLVSALAAVLGADRAELLPHWRPSPAIQLYRLEDRTLDEPRLRRQFDALSLAATSPATVKLDEIDRLFLGGPEG